MAEPLAYEIGLRPKEFEQMQPGEFWKMLEAYQRRQREQDYRTAYFVSYLIAPYLKKESNITVEDIVDPLWEDPEELKKRKAEEKKQKNESDRKVLEKEFAWALKEK